MHREMPFELKGRTLRLQEAIMGDKNPSWDPEPKRKSFRRGPEPSRTLFVTGFDVRDTEEVIKEAFSVYGAVRDVELREFFSCMNGVVPHYSSSIRSERNLERYWVYHPQGHRRRDGTSQSPHRRPHHVQQNCPQYRLRSPKRLRVQHPV